MTDEPIRNPFPNAARRAGAKLEPIAKPSTAWSRSGPTNAERKAAADQLAARLPEPPEVAALLWPADGLVTPQARAVGEHIRARIGDELGPTTLDTEVRDMTDDLSRRSAHRRVGLEIDDAVATQRRLTELVRDLEAQVAELRARDMSIVGAVVRTLRERLRGDR